MADSHPRLLTNYEVLEAVKKRLKTTPTEECRWLLEQNAKYLEPKAGKQSLQGIKAFINECKTEFPTLIERELVQLINIAPHELSIMYCIIENCEMRFKPPELSKLISLVTKHLC